MHSKVKVAVRVRPLLQSEIDQNHQQNFLMVNPKAKEVSIEYEGDAEAGRPANRKAYRFDKLIDGSYSQAEVFDNLNIP